MASKDERPIGSSRRQGPPVRLIAPKLRIFPSIKSDVTCFGERVVGRLDETSHLVVNGKYLFTYKKQKQRWTDTTYSYIDWTENSRYARSLPEPQLNCFSRSIHDWNPTMAHLRKRFTHPLLPSDLCPGAT
jgi:hypothetical protein